jgi:hypothetical protein
MNKIILAKQEFEIGELPFGPLKKLIVCMNRMYQAGTGTDEAMTEVSKIFSILTGKSVPEIDAMLISVEELGVAIDQVPKICGLEERVASGEAQAGTIGTPSTANS